MKTTNKLIGMILTSFLISSCQECQDLEQSLVQMGFHNIVNTQDTIPELQISIYTIFK